MPYYRFELLTGSKDKPIVEHMQSVEATDDQNAKRDAVVWASTFPAALSMATSVRVRSEAGIAFWTKSITSEPDA